uniref:UV excision repair protein RAD23 n=1 Tax=Aureoumbra lagunensis TaxID=44058 RepID=A0A6S8CF64_9STRA
MLVSIKTLEGKVFKVEANPEETIAGVKKIIETKQPELKADLMKLIHSGKVLKDSETLVEKGVTEQSFLVCMVTKPKRTPAPRPAPAPVSAVPQTTPAAPAPQSAVPAPQPAPAPTPAAPQPSTSGSRFATAEAMATLEAMGFGHSDQSRAALEAAMGNVDLAVEFLMNGIPDNHPSPMEEDSPGTGGIASNDPIATIRAHPRFAEIRQTVQQNPASLQTMLQQLGQTDPQLLQLIHQNQAAFLAAVNEPSSAVSGIANTGDGDAEGGANDDDDDDNDAGFDEQAFARAMASITPQQRAQVAATVGLTPDQLEQFARQMQSMPRDQLRQLLGAFAAGGGGPEQRPRVVRLTREEADAVNRLTELGFSRDDAAQAYLACDKNESLAANLLFDGFEPSHGLGAAFPPASISPPTGGSTDTGGDGGSSAPAPPDNAPGNEDEDDDEDMYS